MDQKPFIPLKTRRSIARSDLPPALVEFYAENEGVGLESSAERLVRLCHLSEVTRVGWCDLHTLGVDKCPGWEAFSGVRVGISSFFDEIILVESAPRCRRGAILALGVDLAGPGGVGPAPLESAVVVASTFADWLAHLKECEWVEYGLAPGEIDSLPPRDQDRVRGYYCVLNPDVAWVKSRSL